MAQTAANSNYTRNLLIAVITFAIAMLVTRGQVVLSVVIAALSLYFSASSLPTLSEKKKQEFDFLMEESAFSNYLIKLMALVIRADDHKAQSEIKFIRKALGDHYPPERVNRIVRHVEKTPTNTKFPFKSICKHIRFEFEASAKVQLMYLLMGICTADGVLKKKELALLKKIAVEIRLPYTTFESLLRIFHFIHENEQNKQKKRSYTSKYRLEKAYKILGIGSGATDKEVKKAYRKLALLHHPDRVIHLGKEFQKSAKEKFQLIDQAYDLIKTKRGFI